MVDSTHTFTVARTVTLHHLPGTAGWTSSLGGRLTAIWALPHPVILTAPPGIRLGPLGFSFTVSRAAHDSVTIEAAPDAISGPWTNVASLPLTNGWGTFTTPAEAGPPALFYRARTP